MNIIHKYRSKWIVGIIFLFPLLFYVLLSLGKHQFKKLDFYTVQQKTTEKDKAFILLDVTAFNSLNEKISVAQYKDKITLWHIVRTDDYLLTPAIIANLQYLQQRFQERQDLKMVSIVQNEADSLQIAEFVKLLNINTKNWQIWNSDSVSNNQFAREKLFISYKKLPDSLRTVVPSTQVVLTDQNLYIRGYFDGATHKEVKGNLLDAIDMLIREPFVIYKDKKK